MNRFLRGVVVLLCMALVCAVLFVCMAFAQEPPLAQDTPPPPPITSFQITGTVKSGKTPLPGVTVTAANTLTGKKFSAATAPDGSFVMKGMPRGRYVVKVEFMGFATQTQDVVLNPENPSGKVDTELILASRQQQQEEANRQSAAATAGRGFQSLSVEGGLASLGENGNGSGNGGASASDLSSLPLSGAGADMAAESVSVAGQQGRSQDFGGGSEDELNQRIQDFRERAVQNGGNQYGPMMAAGPGAAGASGQGGPGGPGGPGGGPGGPGGPGGFGGGGGGPISIGRFGRNFNLNQPHGFLYVQDDNAGLDARPYSLNGLQIPQSDYNQLKVGAFIGSPLKIPGLFDWSKSTFVTGGWYAVRGSTPYDALSTVPTEAERAGDFAGLTQNGVPITIYNPQTGQPFPNNTITQINPSAAALLKYIPQPNMPGTLQNFQYVATDESNTDNISFRLIHNFISGGGLPFGPPGGGGIGRGGGRRNGPRNNLNIGFNFTRANTALLNPFPSLAGNTDTQGWNGNAHWVYGKGRITNNLGFTYNHNRTSTTNLYSGVTNVSGDAGITTPVPSVPFNWGLPNLSFISYTGFNDPVPARELDQTYTISDQVVWSRGRHNWRFGGDFRWVLQGFQSAENSQGSFIFTGFATSQYLPGSMTPVPGTGNDFADFLLGLPQQTSVQGGTSSYQFRSNQLDGYVQDDWRILPNLSLNLGVRYEYIGPFTENQNHIANLDVHFGPNDTLGLLVLPGQSGPIFGTYPDSLVRPDRDNWAPRIGIAWRPSSKFVIRTGYGINYDLSQYGTFVHEFAFQPPFATTETNSVPDVTNPAASPLTLQNGFPGGFPTAVTNNYALNPNYKLGYVQIWNLDIQRQLPGNMQLNVGYNGAKGTHLDTQRALVPSCSLNVPASCAGTEVSAPFIFDSSESNSILNAATVRIRKRMSRGFAVNGVYVFSKSLDDASSIGGGAVMVIQNPFDLPAERALSAFDQTHSFTGSWIYDLPFGDNRRFFNRGWVSHVIGGWQWSGSFTVASGLYYTPRVLGATQDINRGVSGSIRANVVAGESFSVPNPSTKEWFNIAAFCQTGNPGCAGPTVYGDAGRDIIEGPWQYTFNSAINKTITIHESRSLELRLSATNIFNTPYFSSINTSVNSLTFGEVTGVSNMRRITMIARFRF
ncbi:MAG TPA: TonB-dependent receptor [Verrucomicrobiae bacterium]|nr:TonB-dependent receptor [Verrucomicrobiae bacterium]